MLPQGEARVVFRVHEGHAFRLRTVKIVGPPEAVIWQGRLPFKTGDVYDRGLIAGFLKHITNAGFTIQPSAALHEDDTVDLTFELTPLPPRT